jgi:hypothetical protein
VPVPVPATAAAWLGVRSFDGVVRAFVAVAVAFVGVVIFVFVRVFVGALAGEDVVAGSGGGEPARVLGERAERRVCAGRARSR